MHNLCNMKRLHYAIADHFFTIETSDPAATRELLPNFEPFRCLSGTGADDDSVNAQRRNHTQPIFSLLGDTPLALPQCESNDCFEWNGIDYEVYHTPEGCIITMELYNRKQLLFATHDWHHLYTDLPLMDKRESRFLNNFIVVAFGMATASQQTVKVHASVIEKEGEALLFLGKSGTGKSTHSRLWQQFVKGASLLNDDEPVVRLYPDGDVRVFGTPWSGKTPCYQNRWAEVVAFVQLCQHNENILTPQNGIAAFSSLLQSTCVMRSDTLNREMVTDTLSEILQHKPVYRLDCRADEEAVRLTEGLMNGTFHLKR